MRGKEAHDGEQQGAGGEKLQRCGAEAQETDGARDARAGGKQRARAGEHTEHGDDIWRLFLACPPWSTREGARRTLMALHLGAWAQVVRRVLGELADRGGLIRVRCVVCGAPCNQTSISKGA